MTENKMKVLDLFSGIGGFSLGLGWAGMETVAFCEIDEDPRRTLKKNWPNIPFYRDIRSLTGEQLRKEVGKIDIITGGFPCTDISNAGKRAGIKGANSGLWSEYARLIGEIRPRWAIIENVAALRSKGLITVLQDLREIGYDAEWHCIPASRIGARHRRDRIWIVAYPSRRRSGRELSNIYQPDVEEYEPEKQGQSQAGGFVNAGEHPQVLADSSSSELKGDSKRILRESAWDDSMYGRKDLRLKNGEAGADISGPNDEDLAYPHSQRLEIGEIVTENIRSELVAIERMRDEHRQREERQTEPGICRGFNGVQSWMDGSWEAGISRTTSRKEGRAKRLKALGNSIVPQMAEIIGKAIMGVE